MDLDSRNLNSEDTRSDFNADNSIASIWALPTVTSVNFTQSSLLSSEGICSALPANINNARYKTYQKQY